ncbi:protein SLC31A2-like [Dysidea avara]|uniref:protein SLC31A2-like n=1 Tax=Dysidea avara TaxID=196820 RepID=UPI003329747C
MEDTMLMNRTMCMETMPMHFYFGYHNVRVLVKGWEINSIGVLLASVAAIYICAVLYEGLKTLRQVLYHNRFKMLNTAKTYLNVNYEKLTSVVEVKSEKTREPSTCRSEVVMTIIQTLLYMLQITVGYFLMLTAMTYNAWLFISIILGAGTGYLCFGRFRISDKIQAADNGHCCN